jgi:hypothetical protein
MPKVHLFSVDVDDIGLVGLLHRPFIVDVLLSNKRLTLYAVTGGEWSPGCDFLYVELSRASVLFEKVAPWVFKVEGNV